ncbi:hypothetical protein A3K70_00460 [Candidatus Bathyarchaeota archaeon RBG_16_48_13]|nr:MAG: hypothetical protein A3K70_00460 [Candidatus Bathyarchaeota archaeon RBG_16_48_13]
METAGYFKLAEDLGLEYGWGADQTFSPSIYSLLTLSAHLTKHIKLGTSVTNPYSRHPVIHATSGAAIDELSGGRFILGLGAGEKSAIESLGIERPKTKQMLRESVEIIRRLLKGEKVTYDGELLSLSNVKLMFQPRRVFPIYVGARGPKTLQLAGEIGDGVLIDVCDPTEGKIAIAETNKGIEKAGKKPGETEIISAVSFAVDEDPEKAKNKVKWLAAVIAASVPQEVLDRHDISLSQIRALKEHLGKKGTHDIEPLVTKEMLETFTLAGSPRQCVARIETMERAGFSQIDLVIIDTVHENIQHQIKLLAEKILPHVK